MLEKSIRDFPKQFEFEPKIENRKNLVRHKKILICGMGGSQLPTGVLKAAYPHLDIIDWHSYDLPLLGDLKERLIIAVSYSGGTEETISSFNAARKARLPVAAVAIGGALIALAEEHKASYVRIPNTGIQPRMGTGFMLRAVMALMGDRNGLKATGELAKTLEPGRLEREGKDIAKAISGRVPVIYASEANGLIARNWKIKFNENGKIPAFWNVFPELNHNEMTGFDTVPGTRALASHFHFIFLEDKADHPRIVKRMKVMKDLFEGRGLGVTEVRLSGESFSKIFRALVLGDWASYATALRYGTEPEEVPMVEEFKKLI